MVPDLFQTLDSGACIALALLPELWDMLSEVSHAWHGETRAAVPSLEQGLGSFNLTGGAEKEQWVEVCTEKGR